MCFPANISICFVLNALLAPVPEITVCDCCHSSPCAQRLVCVRTWKPHKSSWGSRVNALITVCIVHIQQHSRTFVGYLQFKEFILFSTLDRSAEVLLGSCSTPTVQSASWSLALKMMNELHLSCAFLQPLGNSIIYTGGKSSLLKSFLFIFSSFYPLMLFSVILKVIL